MKIVFTIKEGPLKEELTKAIANNPGIKDAGLRIFTKLLLSGDIDLEVSMDEKKE